MKRNTFKLVIDEDFRIQVLIGTMYNTYTTRGNDQFCVCVFFLLKPFSGIELELLNGYLLFYTTLKWIKITIIQ